MVFPVTAKAQKENAVFIGREYIAASFAVRNHEYDSAAELFAQAADESPKDAFLLDKAYKYMLIAGNNEKAVYYAQKYLAIHKKSILPQLLIAMVDTRNGEFARASGILSDLMQSSNNKFVLSVEQIFIPFIRIWLIAAEGNYDVALGALEPHDINGVISNTFMQLQQALLYSLSNQNEKAEKSFDDITKAEGVMPYNLAKSAASFYESIEKWDKALLIYNKYKEQHPSALHFNNVDDRISQHLKSGLYVQNPLDGISEVLKEAAKLLFSNELYDNGLIYLRLALIIKPHDEEANILLASVHEKFDEWQQAIELYNNIPEESDFYWSVEVNRAEDLFKLGKKSDARKLLLHITDKVQDKQIPLVMLADLLRQDEEFEDAAHIYSRVLQIIDDDNSARWSILFARGICYERSDMWHKAEADFLAALRLHHDQPDVVNYLAYSWVDRGMHLKRATNMLLKAATKRPNEPQLLDSVGWALYKNGDYEDAATFVEKALKKLPQDPLMNDHLGDIYWMLNRKYEAVYQWQHALKYIKPGEPPKEQDLKNKIEHGLPCDKNTCKN